MVISTKLALCKVFGAWFSASDAWVCCLFVFLGGFSPGVFSITECLVEILRRGNQFEHLRCFLSEVEQGEGGVLCDLYMWRFKFVAHLVCCTFFRARSFVRVSFRSSLDFRVLPLSGCYLRMLPLSGFFLRILPLSRVFLRILPLSRFFLRILPLSRFVLPCRGLHRDSIKG